MYVYFTINLFKRISFKSVQLLIYIWGTFVHFVPPVGASTVHGNLEGDSDIHGDRGTLPYTLP